MAPIEILTDRDSVMWASLPRRIQKPGSFREKSEPKGRIQYTPGLSGVSITNFLFSSFLFLTRQIDIYRDSNTSSFGEFQKHPPSSFTSYTDDRHE